MPPPTLTTLPPELLHQIQGYLPPTSVTNLARTFNKKLYSICHPRLTRILFSHQNHNKMHTRFNAKPHNWGIETARNVRITPSFDYLHLSGDLYWLQEDIKNLSVKEYPNSRYNEVPSPELLEKLRKQAEKAGVELPPSFLQFFTNAELLQKFPGDGLKLFSIFEEGLFKCPAQFDGGNGGYILQFFHYGVDNVFGCLYLDPSDTIVGKGKGYCILLSDTSPDDYCCDWCYENPRAGYYDEYKCVGRSKDIKREGWKIANVYGEYVTLLSTEFEKFLVRLYFGHAVYEIGRTGKVRKCVEEFVVDGLGLSVKEYVEGIGGSLAEDGAG